MMWDRHRAPRDEKVTLTYLAGREVINTSPAVSKTMMKTC